MFPRTPHFTTENGELVIVLDPVIKIKKASEPKAFFEDYEKLL